MNIKMAYEYLVTDGRTLNLKLLLHPITADQGQTLNRIEDTMQDAQEYVEKAKKQTAKAIEHQKSSNKKCCCCIVLLVVLAGVIALSIGISFA